MPGSNEFRSPEPGLTDAERRQLAELERGLIADDPALAEALIGGGVHRSRPNRAAIALVAAAAVIILVFAVVVGGPGAAAFTSVSVLVTGLLALKVRAHPAP
jgi:hypothetical protein